MNPYYSLFKSYDVRGTYPQINATVAYWTGYAFVKEILEKGNLGKKVILMRDCRISSPELYKAAFKGIKDAGGEPLPLGIASSDMLYAATQLLECAGIMITASHNPPKDNGLKLVKKAPQMLGVGGGLEIIRDSQYFQNPKEIDSSIIDEVIDNTEEKERVLEFYKNEMKEILDIDRIQEKLKSRKFRVVVDTANGMGGYVMDQITQVIPQIEFIPLFWDLDGNYPNHEADPTKPENLVFLQKAIQEQKADFGIAFDGDADRAMFMDENSTRLIGDYIVAKFGEFMIKRHANNPKLDKFNPSVVYNIPASRCTKDIVISSGGNAIASMQGHNHMKAMMLENKAIYGGEHSGHHYFGEFGYMDAGFLAACLFINILVSEDIKASELTKALSQKYLLSGELNFKLNDSIDTKERIHIYDEKLKSKFMDAYFDYLDGISVIYTDWKFNVRLSNTEPLLRLNVEIINSDNTKSLDDVKFKVEEIKNILGLV